MKKSFLQCIPLCILLSFLVTGCNQETGSTSKAVKPPVVEKTEQVKGPVYKGKIVGKSNKAKQISIAVGKGKDAKTIMVSFDEKTKGLEHANKGHGAIIAYEMREGRPYATVIKPKLAKLPKGVSTITPAEVLALIQSEKQFVLIDSRPGNRYSSSHLPGSISIPVCKMQELLQNLPKDKNKLLVFYCGGPTCGMSPKSAGQAVTAGYKNVKVMLAGEPGWIKAGYPTYANYGFVCRGNNVIVDLRSAEKDKAARIPRSVSMPFADFDFSYDAIPIKAPVVLYSDNDQESIAALKMLKKEGYKSVSLVEGGFHGWKRVGGTLIKGDVVTDVSWKRILNEGEITLKEFKKAMAEPDYAIILDVRTRDEIKEGKLPTSQHIPLDELCKDMDRFSTKIVGAKVGKDGKKIFVHCTTGARAEMAYKELKKRDFNAYYLVAEVNCEGSNCTIED